MRFTTVVEELNRYMTFDPKVKVLPEFQMKFRDAVLEYCEFEADTTFVAFELSDETIDSLTDYICENVTADSLEEFAEKISDEFVKEIIKMYGIAIGETIHAFSMFKEDTCIHTEYKTLTVTEIFFDYESSHLCYTDGTTDIFTSEYIFKSLEELKETLGKVNLAEFI